MAFRANVLIAGGFVGMAIATATATATARFGAMPIQETPALVPRYFLDQSFPHMKRDGSCGTDKHPCLDVQRGDKCCANNQYCYINAKDDLRCCPIGSDCPNDNTDCESGFYACYSTFTITRSVATPTVGSMRGCCARACPQTSSYLCPPDRGNKCCPYGFECQADGNCVRAVPPSNTPLVLPIPEGCTTSQFQCQDGQGCCDQGRECTQVSNTGYCAIPSPTDTNISIVEESSKGLSDGAKAGVAIGAVFGAGIIIAALTWICLRRRRRRRRTATQPSVSAAGRPQHDGNMTELTAASTFPPDNGLTQDYFGPVAGPGPYTDYTIASTAATSPNPERGVPTQPHSPGDIPMPVEIDDSRAQSPESVRTNSYYATPMSHLMDVRHELHDTGMPPAQYIPPGERSPSLQHTPPNLTPRNERP